VVETADTPQKLKVFVSYSRKDEDFAEQLVAALDACGFAPYLDKQDVAPGEPWEQRLRALIQQADTVIFVISPDSIGSQRCAWEVAETKRLSKRLLPVVWRLVPEAQIPRDLQLLNFIFFDKANSFGTGLGHLSQALNTDLNWIREHTRLAERAAHWDTRGRPDILLIRGQEVVDAKAWLSRRPKDAPEPTFLHREFIAESEKVEAAQTLRDREREARTRRLRLAVSSSVLGLLVFLGIAGYAARQSFLADQSRERSVEIAYGFVEATASISDRLGVPVNATLTLLKQSEQTLDQLAASEGEGSNLKYRRAQVMIRVARTYAQTGKSDEHLGNAQKAMEILERLVKADPNNGQYSNDLAAGMAEIGNAYLARGELSGAHEAFLNARSVRVRLVGSDPGNVGWQRDLGLLYDSIAGVLVARGKLDEALETYRNGLAIAERLVATDPGKGSWQRDLGLLYASIAGVLVAQGKLDEALKRHRDSLAIAERLVTSDPANTGWQRDLSVSYSRVGELLQMQGRLDDALKSYRDGLAIADRLTTTDPSNTIWQRDLFVSYFNIGSVLVAQGRLDEGIKSAQDSLAIAQRLVMTDPANKGWQRDLGLSYTGIGLMLELQGNFDEALTRYRDSLAIAELLATTDPANTGWQRDLGSSYSRIGDVLVRQDKLEDALKSYRDGLAIAERLVTADPGNAGWQRDLGLSYTNIGAVLQRQGKLDEALKSYRAGLAIAERLAALDQSNFQWQNDLQSSADKIGGLAYDFVLARDFATALEVSELVISIAPNKIWLRTNLAHALMFLGRVDEARSLYLRYRGEKKVDDEKPWETIVLDDFAEMRKAGLTHPLMDEIEKLFAAGG
jgi:tetratricopeptide (TPR) repeat protein